MHKTASYLDKRIIAAIAVSVFALAIAGASFTFAQGVGGERRALTEEQKEVMEQVRALHDEGKFEEAQALLEEAGLGKFVRAHLSDEEREAMRAKHEAIRAAIEAEDYEAFLVATQDAPFKDDITEEMFEKLVEAHALREAGDHEGARAVLEAMGFPGMMGRGHGAFHRFDHHPHPHAHDEDVEKSSKEEDN